MGILHGKSVLVVVKAYTLLFKLEERARLVVNGSAVVAFCADVVNGRAV